MPHDFPTRRFGSVLWHELDPLTHTLVAATVERLPEYAALSNDGYDEKLTANIRSHLEVFHDILMGGRFNQELMSFAYRSAAERARQGFALAAILQSYQLVTRGLWKWATTHEHLREDAEALRESWPVWLDYADQAARAAAEAFQVTARQRDQADADARRTFIDMLLAGRVIGLEWTRWLGSFGHDSADVRFCLVVLQWWDEGEYRVMDVVARTARALSERLRAASGVAPIDAVRDREVVMLVSAARLTPARIKDEVRRSLATRPDPALNVSGAISHPLAKAEEVIDAYSQIRRTVAVTRRIGDVAVVDEIGLFDHAIAALRMDVRKVASSRLAEFMERCARDPRDYWLPTVRSWATHNMNAGACAQDLHVHRNTVYYRLRQVAELSGSDPQTVSGLADLLVAIHLLEEFGS